jgi:ABC-type Mn2+/Zn2+ transport system permease subunit
MPEPWSRFFWMVIIVSIIGMAIAVAGIWFFWYILIPVSMGLLITALIIYLKKVRIEEETFEFENAEEEQ